MSSSSEASDIEAGREGAAFVYCVHVFMYVSMVSGLGLMLSAYHFFAWDSTMPPVANIPGHENY